MTCPRCVQIIPSQSQSAVLDFPYLLPCTCVEVVPLLCKVISARLLDHLSGISVSFPGLLHWQGCPSSNQVPVFKPQFFKWVWPKTLLQGSFFYYYFVINCGGWVPWASKAMGFPRFPYVQWEDVSCDQGPGNRKWDVMEPYRNELQITGGSTFTHRTPRMNLRHFFCFLIMKYFEMTYPGETCRFSVSILLHRCHRCVVLLSYQNVWDKFHMESYVSTKCLQHLCFPLLEAGQWLLRNAGHQPRDGGKQKVFGMVQLVSWLTDDLKMHNSSCVSSTEI